MFADATAFAGDTSKWVFEGAITTQHMFHGAAAYNSDINAWLVLNTSNGG